MGKKSKLIKSKHKARAVGPRGFLAGVQSTPKEKKRSKSLEVLKQDMKALKSISVMDELKHTIISTEKLQYLKR